MYVSSFWDQGSQPMSKQVMLVLACSALDVDQSCLFVREDVQVVMYQCSPGRYAYVKFHENGELELFLPRSNQRKVPC